jgi:uncharacterized membrane protein YqhA
MVRFYGRHSTDNRYRHWSGKGRVSLLERLFERALWLSRLVVIVPVIACVVMAVSAFYLGTVDVVYLVTHLASYADAGAIHATERATLLSAIIRALDDYLLAAILLIVALGLYELFIGRIDAAEREEFASRLLLIRSVDDLKDRLAKVVLLVLIVEFLQHALTVPFKNALDLLYLAVGIALIGLALYLTTKH